MAPSGQGGDAAVDARARARQMAAAMVARGSNGPGGPRQAPVSGAPAAAPRQTGARQPAGGESSARPAADDDRPRPARQDLYFDTSADRRPQASRGTGPDAPAASAPAAHAPAIATTLDFDGDWPSLVARLHAQGAVRQLLAQSELKGVQGLVFQVQVPIRHLVEPSLVERARELLADHFGAGVQLQVTVGQTGGQTAAARASEQQARRQAESEEAIKADPFVRTLLEEFGATILPDSIKPLDGEKSS